MSSRAASVTGFAAGYARLRGGEPAGVRVPGCLIWVEGPDAGGFLQGLLTNDVDALAPGGGCAALLLDAKGHVVVELRVHRDSEEAFTLVVDPAPADTLAAELARYHFSEDLEILGPEPAELLSLTAGIAGARGEGGIAVPGPLPGTVALVVDDPEAALARLGVPEAPPEALEAARIAAGVPRVGLDTGPATLVQEAGLEEAAVSFHKGCYLGQETVARVAFRGHVNRRLRGLALSEPAQAGAGLTLDGRPMGTLTSVAVTPDLGPIGLAILRREAEPGAELVVEGYSARARVVTLPFGRP